MGFAVWLVAGCGTGKVGLSSSACDGVNCAEAPNGGSGVDVTRGPNSDITLAPDVDTTPVADDSRRLSPETQRAYLVYYSPLIFKEADEESQSHWGYDWITNFDFDQDNSYATNKENWEQVDDYVESVYEGRGVPAAMQQWQIRPTLYTSLIEFMEGERKSLILIYHVYHAMQDGAIHDWERIEIRIDDVGGSPGLGPEQINYVVITTHGDHVRKHLGRDLNFMETDTGRHLMIWQAKWSNEPFYSRSDFRKAELHFIEDNFAKVHDENARDDEARLNVNGSGDRADINYVFVCENSSAAVDYWGAEALTHTNAGKMAARKSRRDDFSDLPRITYELQDIADIAPSHWAGGDYARHWRQPTQNILFEEPLVAPGFTIPSKVQVFHVGSANDREGYVGKSWFWGAYNFGHSGSFANPALSRGAPNGTRGIANGRLDSHGAFWMQHDYFAHDGQDGDGSDDGDSGVWLPSGWHTAERGGFDGRWSPLFPD